MVLGTARIGKTLPIAGTLLTIYVKGGPTIFLLHTLVLDDTVWDKFQVKNMMAQEIQTGFNNRHTVDQ